MVRRKALVLSTLVAAVFVFAGVSLYTVSWSSSPVAINTAGYTSLGNNSSPVEILVIEDFLCRNCRTFTLDVLSKIQSEYVKQGAVRLTVVPVAFISGSKPIANAALEVYRNYPDRFFPFLHEVAATVHEGDVKTSDLLAIAQKVGGIDLNKLQQCIETGAHDKELENNLVWAYNFMGYNFRTPALFINGSPGSTFSFAAVKDQINQILGRKS